MHVTRFMLDEMTKQKCFRIRKPAYSFPLSSLTIYNKVWNKKTVLNSKIKAFCLLGYFTTNKPLIYEELDTKF